MVFAVDFGQRTNQVPDISSYPEIPYMANVDGDANF